MTDRPEVFSRDFQLNDTVYRRLDPEYYAWLRSRMNTARLAMNAGQIPSEAYEELRDRFNSIHAWAIERLGQITLIEAVRNLRAANYCAPAAELDSPACGARAAKARLTEPTPEACAVVEAICDRAVALGWKKQRLLSVGEPGSFSRDRGLVCFVKADDRIGEITTHSIEIIRKSPSPARLRFFNPDVDQPWIRRAEKNP